MVKQQVFIFSKYRVSSTLFFYCSAYFHPSPISFSGLQSKESVCQTSSTNEQLNVSAMFGTMQLLHVVEKNFLGNKEWSNCGQEKYIYIY